MNVGMPPDQDVRPDKAEPAAAGDMHPLLAQVEVPGVENINLSRLIAGHQDYLVAMEDILEAINMHDT